MATPWHPKGLWIARVVSDFCRIYLRLAVESTGSLIVMGADPFPISVPVCERIS